MLDDFWMGAIITAAVIAILVSAIGFGMGLSTKLVRDDCVNHGTVKLFDTFYECKEIKNNDDDKGI